MDKVIKKISIYKFYSQNIWVVSFTEVYLWLRNHIQCFSGHDGYLVD